MMNRRPFPPPFLLAAVAAAVAGGPPALAQEAELGFLGFQPPEVGDVRVPDTLLHTDTTGGVLQQLMGVSGSRGDGFGLVWRDQRDGTLGIYCARLDADGNLREPERPVSSAPATSRRFDPAIALAPDGAGAVAWVQRHATGHRPWLRCFNAEGTWYGTDLVLQGAAGGPGQARGGVNRDASAGVARSPVLLARSDGSRTVIWSEGGRLRQADFDVAGSPLRPAADLGPAGTEAGVGILAVEDSEGGVAALWSGKGSAWFARRAPGNPRSIDVEVGSGSASGLVALPGGGFWALLQRGESAVLRRVGLDGKLEGLEVVRALPGLRAAELALQPGGLALLATLGGATAPAARDGGRGKPAREQMAGPGAQRPGARASAPRGEGVAESGPSRLELHLLDAAGTATDPAPLVVTSAAARDVEDAHLASNGARLLVAWTDSRLGDADVWGRIVDPAQSGAARLGPEKRLNSDFASSDQITPDVDARGDRGWAVWHDRRSGPGTIYARPFGATGPSGPEIPLPVVPSGAQPAPPADGNSDPVVSIRPDGTVLVAWIQRDVGRSRLVGQVLTREGGAKSGLFEIDAREPATIEKAAISPLAGDRGWIALWPAGGKLGIHGRRIAPDGSLPGPARRVNEAGEDDTRQADVALLDDGRLVAAWTSHAAGAPPEKGWTVRARFLDAEGAAKGNQIAFEPSRRNEDSDPALAPAQDGGFLMAWCSGPPGDPTHDVNVRLFDAQGRAAGPNLTPCFLANEQDYADVTRLADGSFAVAWEDDVSYFDQTYVRRIRADGRSMGPWMRINKLDTRFVPDRVAPRIAAFGDGWAAVFADRQRSLGFDARIKIVGPGWDTPSGG